MTSKRAKWAWALGVPGAVLAGLTLVYGGLSAVFETRTAHADDVATWRAELAAEVVARGLADEALNAKITGNYDALRKTTDEMQRDVTQLVCVVVKKGKPFGARCTLPSGETDNTP